jgi:hypothetical protein
MFWAYYSRYAQMRARPTMDEPLTRANREKNYQGGFCMGSSSLSTAENVSDFGSQEVSGCNRKLGNVFVNSFLRRSGSIITVNIPPLSIAQMREQNERRFNKDKFDQYCRGEVFVYDIDDQVKMCLSTVPISRATLIYGKIKVLTARELIFSYLAYAQATGDWDLFNDVDLQTADMVGKMSVYVHLGKSIEVDTWNGDRGRAVKYAVGCQMKTAA